MGSQESKVGIRLELVYKKDGVVYRENFDIGMPPIGSVLEFEWMPEGVISKGALGEPLEPLPDNYIKIFPVGYFRP